MCTNAIVQSKYDRLPPSACQRPFTSWNSILLQQHKTQPGIQRVQALADILHSALCCHSNETRAPTANPPNSAQLEGTPTIPSSYTRVSAVVWECGEGQTDRYTDARDHMRNATIGTLEKSKASMTWSSTAGICLNYFGLLSCKLLQPDSANCRLCLQCLVMAALRSRCGHYTFVLWFLLSSFFISSPNLSGRRLDVYHTSTHGEALVRI